MKLVYWLAPCLDDSHVYSIREKTKKAVVAKLNSGEYRKGSYGPVEKVVVEYSDAFDLMNELYAEGNYGSY